MARIYECPLRAPSSTRCGRQRIRPLQAQAALLYAAARERLVRLFLGSSAVEHPTVNRMVAGSNPARGAKFNRIFNDLSLDSDLARNLVAAESQLNVCGGREHAAAGTPNRLNSNRASKGRAFTELIPMRDIQVDRSQRAPSIL